MLWLAFFNPTFLAWVLLPRTKIDQHNICRLGNSRRNMVFAYRALLLLVLLRPCRSHHGQAFHTHRFGDVQLGGKARSSFRACDYAKKAARQPTNAPRMITLLDRQLGAPSTTSQAMTNTKPKAREKGAASRAAVTAAHRLALEQGLSSTRMPMVAG
jgi:hypothetical protein